MLLYSQCREQSKRFARGGYTLSLIGSGPLNHSGQSPQLTSPSGHSRSGPCLGTVWADTDNPVYQIEINEINEMSHMPD